MGFPLHFQRIHSESAITAMTVLRNRFFATAFASSRQAQLAVYHPLSAGVRWMIAGVVASLLSVLVRPYLPERHLDLFALTGEPRVLLMSEETNSPAGDTVIEWVDRSRHHFHCNTNAERALPLCGLFLDLNQRQSGKGQDFSGYQKLVMRLRYQGTSQHVRVSMASFVKGESVVGDHRTWRPQSGYIAIQSINEAPVVLKLAAWAVPEWWLMSPEATRSTASGLDFTNCVTLTVDVPYLGGKNWHDFEVSQLELRGEFISSSQLYLLLLSLWFLAAVAFVSRRLMLARQIRAEHMQLISALTDREHKLRSEQRDLRRKATVDALTGLLNRSGMELALLDLPGSTTDRCAVMMIDVDHFKRVNDIYGHNQGDKVLRHVAAVLTQSMRADDIVCRWGGEEFIILATCGLADAALVAEKVRQRVAESRGGDVCSVTVSIGVTKMLGAGDFDAAMHRADKAMYKAKQQGRNRVVVEEAPGTHTG